MTQRLKKTQIPLNERGLFIEPHQTIDGVGGKDSLWTHNGENNHQKGDFS